MQRSDEEIYEEQERRRIKARRERRRKRRKQQIIFRAVTFIVFFLALLLIVMLVHKVSEKSAAEEAVVSEPVKYVEKSPDFAVELLTVNEYSRPGTELAQVNGIVVHYTANPGTTAEQNRSYFESLAETGETHASSHFIIGISGEIIQCIPCNEISYASNDRNSDTISVECCIPDESGKFTDETYQSLVELVAWLFFAPYADFFMKKYNIPADHVIRHYDVTGKDCPKYFVENSNAWSDFKTDLLTYIDTYGIEKTQEIN